MVQLSHLYMTTGKTIVLTIWTLIGQVMSLNFNTLSRFVIAFLPRSEGLFISWLRSPSAVILEPKKIKSVSFHFFLFYCYEVMGAYAMILVFWMLSFKPAFSLSHPHQEALSSLFTFTDKMWSTGEGNGKPLQYSCLKNPMNSMKRQKN